MVVSNTTPLSNLLHLGQTQILHKLFGSVSVPIAVRDELEAYFGESSSWKECRSAGWVVVEPAEDQRLVKQFMTFMHAGEAEAVVLALEKNAGLVLIDDRDGRNAAEENDLKVCGTVGILIKAKATGLIPDISSALNKLRQQHVFWLSDAMYREALRLSGE